MAQATPRLKRDRSLWFDDGNMVIAAAPSDTKKGLLFRVHKFILAMHSPVFADMFTLPDIPAETANPKDFYDGVPLVRMYDKAQDVRGLLKYYYDPSSFVLERYDPETPNKIRGLLHLARKYQITPLWDRLVKHFKADWPRTLNEWDVVEGEARARAENQSYHIIFDDPVYVDDVFPEPGTAIRLARELDIQEILPAAFYHLSRLKITRDRFSTDFSDDVFDGDRSADWSVLSAEDFRCLLFGREEMEQYIMDVWRRFAFHCCNNECNAFETVPNRHRTLYHSKDVLDDLKNFIPSGQYSNKELCRICTLDANSIAQQVRREIWEKLPAFFRLPCLPHESDSDVDA